MDLEVANALLEMLLGIYQLFFLAVLFPIIALAIINWVSPK